MSTNSKNDGRYLDTGTGGFTLGVSGDRHAYDVGAEDDPTDRSKWNSGNIKVDKTVKDLTPSTKKTLASYLSDTTLGKTPSAATSKPNAYPVDAAEVNEVALTDKNGNVVPPTESPNKSKFAGWGSVTSRSAAATQETLNFQRGRQTVPGQANPIDGNRLLRDATVEGAMRAAAGTPIGTSPVDGKISPVTTTVLDANSPLASYSRSLINNRFNPDNTYETLSSDKIGGGQFSRSYALGQSLGPTDERDVTFGRLAQIGAALSIRSGLELSSADPGNNPNSGPSEAGAILPGLNQLGVERIETSLLTAEDVIRDLTSEGITEDNLIDVTSLSWGSLNNVLDQYAGISNFGMQLLAVALLVALVLVIGLFSVLFNFPSPRSTPKLKDKLGRYAYGAFEADTSGANYDSIGGIIKAIISGKFNFWKVLGITSTNKDPKECLPVGALAFFGVRPSEAREGGGATTAMNAALSVAQSPGYYAVMARSVNRSFLLIGDAFKSIGKAFGNGLVAGVKQLLSIIDVIKNSKFIRAVNIFAQLGDRVLRDTSTEEHLSKDQESFGSGVRHLGEIDLNANGDAIRRNRLDNKGDASIGGLVLAWSAHRSPDLIMLPQGVASIMSHNSHTKLGVPDQNHSIHVHEAGLKMPIVPSAESRLSTEEREKMENRLEAEYMPFYFHDVRTNEIISFHAFLASLSDDFTASYDSVDAFGRVEPIKAYKGTQRKIGFSFYAIATNSKDFDTLWIKINKLVTLVYPQFSEGRTLVDDNNGYTMYAPFSQTIQASPMIRVRIGDLIRSNYSKFNLARLFGYTYAESKFGGYPLSFATKPLGNEEESIEKDLFRKKVTDSYKSKPGTTFFTAVKPTTPGESSSSSPIPVPLPTAAVSYPALPHPLYKGLVLKVVDAKDDIIICEIDKATGIDKDSTLTPEDIRNISSYDGKSRGNDWHILGKKYSFASADLIPTPSTKKKIDEEVYKNWGDNASYTDEVLKFMDDESGNAVAKSFRSVSGRGLAGFIESLSFDWYEKATWETSGYDESQSTLGRRAPKMCKVTVSFSPIHDITPGLDHVGGNRAPVYPVGPMYGREKINK